MVCELTTLSSISDFLVWPTLCYYNFYTTILFGLMIIISWILYKAEQARTGEGDYISSLGVSSIAISSLALSGTLISNSDSVAMIQLPILMYILAVTVIIVLIWIFKD